MRIYHEMIDKLRNGAPFKFSRWGDGEWGCMYGVTGQNRDGNTYLSELGEKLRAILNSQPQYYMGLQYGVLYNEQLRDYVFDKMFKLSNINWVFGDVLHVASEKGLLRNFTNALKDRYVVMIGAEYFKGLSTKAGRILDAMCITPENNSFNSNDSIFYCAEQYYMKDPVFLVAAAMNSNVIIDKLPDSVTAIDIGSVFDPYLGRPRASYQHKMNVTLKDLF